MKLVSVEEGVNHIGSYLLQLMIFLHRWLEGGDVIMGSVYGFDQCQCKINTDSVWACFCGGGNTWNL